MVSEKKLLVCLPDIGCSLLATAKSASKSPQPENSLPFCLDPAAWQIGESDEFNKWLLDLNQSRLKTPGMTITKHNFGNPVLSDFVLHRTAGGSEVIPGAQTLQMTHLGHLLL